MKCIILLALLISISRVSAGRPLTFETKQHILISRDTSLSPDHLCHDGQHLYFNNFRDCLAANFNADVCVNDLKLTPLREMQRIYLDTDRKKSILRSHRINLEFQVYKYNLHPEGFYELDDKPMFRRLGLCPYKIMKEQKVVYSERQVYGEIERKFLEELFADEILWISTGPGPILNINQIKIDSPTISKEQISASIIDEQIKSPHCSSVLPQDWVHQMGGEWSGNSISKTTFDFVEKTANELQYRGVLKNVQDNELQFGCKESVIEI